MNHMKINLINLCRHLFITDFETATNMSFERLLCSNSKIGIYHLNCDAIELDRSIASKSAALALL